MSKGKLAVQAGHASVGAFLECESELKYEWMEEGQRKVALRAADIFHLKQIYIDALNSDIPAYLVEDLGLTEFDEPTVTCLGLGPCLIERMDEITSKLPLF